MWEAVRKFNQMIPTLNGFARSLTGNPRVRVRASKVTQTDGTVIEIRPPLALAQRIEHKRDLCDKRDSDKQLMCFACARQDDIWRKLHHELAHIIGNSMEFPNGTGLGRMMTLVDEYHPVGVCDHGMQMKADILASKSYVEASAKFSPYLHHIVQCLEDARIDSHMISVKPGLRTQFYASTWSTFTYGVETDEGHEAFFWRDAPVNAQAVIGLMLIGSGYRVEEGWLRDEVRLLMEDEELRAITKGAGHWESVHITAGKAVSAFRRLIEVGLFADVPRCTPKQEEPPSLKKPGEEGEKSDERDEPAEGERDESQSDQESDDDSGDTSSDDADASDGEPGSSEDAGDPTGDGSAGDGASSGAFGNDFENPDDRADGDDQQGGDSDGQSEGASVPGGDGDDESDSSGRDADESDNEDDSDSAPAAGDDQAEADDATADEGSPVTGEDEGEAGDQGDQEQRDPASGTAPVDGDEDAPDERGDDSGESPSQGEGDIGSDPGGSGDGDGAEVDDVIEGTTDDTGSEDSGAHEDSADEVGGSDEASDDYLTEFEEPDDEPLGESVWDQENDPSQAVRSIPIEEFGTVEEVSEKLEQGNPHEHVDEAEEVDSEPGYTDEEILVAANAALDEAIGQAGYFDRASTGVGGVREYEYGKNPFRWGTDYWYKPKPKEFTPAESVIGKALMKARAVFADNARAKRERNLRSGKINGRALGRRAPLQDDRLFQRKTLPGKKEYIVGITLDCSGSTEDNFRMERIKRAAFAKAELLARLGVEFYITAHTGGKEEFWTHDYYRAMAMEHLEDVMILWIKRPGEPWNDKTRDRLAALTPLANNFDGHTLEFHRKLLQSRRESDKVLLYYTDGAMPAANYQEERPLLEEEIVTCKKLGITLGAVGINTDSPKEYGFETVRVDSDDDLIKVVNLLERMLTR